MTLTAAKLLSQTSDVFDPDANVYHVAENARCCRCKVKGHNAFRIIYVGGRWESMQDSQDKQHESG